MSFRLQALSQNNVATSPAYSADTETQWTYGPGGLDNGDVYAGVDSGLDDNSWAVWTTLMNLNPGSYTIEADGFIAYIAFTEPEDWKDQKLTIWSQEGGLFTKEYEFQLDAIPVANQQTTSQSFQFTLTDGEQTIVLEEGKEYHFGLAVQGETGRGTNRPGVRLESDGSDDPCYRLDGFTTIPNAVFASAVLSGSQMMQQITFRTKKRILYNGELASGDNPVLPRRKVYNGDNGITSIKFSDVVVADADALTIAFDNEDGTALETIVLDFGATDQITADGNNIAATGEGGDTFDILYQYDPTGVFDVLYQNRSDGQGPEGSADFATFSHSTKNGGSRDSRYTTNTAYSPHIEISGTGTIGEVEVGCEPVVIFGDSMSSFSGRIGQHLPTAFTHDRIYWRAQISGNKLTQTASSSHTAGIERFKSTTEGEGDLIEINDCLFVFAMYGLNDVVRIGSTAANFAEVTADFMTDVNSIITDVLARGNIPFIIGLAPYHASANADAEECFAIQFWNLFLENICLRRQVAWFDPWFTVVDPATEGDSIPRIRSEYTDDGGTHINSAASQAICAAAAAQYELAVVPERRDGKSPLVRRMAKVLDERAV